MDNSIKKNIKLKKNLLNIKSKKNKLFSGIKTKKKSMNLNLSKNSVDKELFSREKSFKENITILKSINENYLSWIIIIICLYIISPNNIFKGIITFISFLLFAYILHYFSHINSNMSTILHKYHHKYNNFFSIFIQILLELTIPVILLPFYFLYKTIYLDIWIIIFSTLFYSTVHNINYGYFRVNNIHLLHHKYSTTNIGPDICDIIFGTKNIKNKTVENTNHYIPNVILITIFILLLKYLCKNDNIRIFLINIIILFLLLSSIFLLISTIYLYIYKKELLENKIIKLT
jgi:hypothetical protein